MTPVEQFMAWLRGDQSAPPPAPAATPEPPQPQPVQPSPQGQVQEAQVAPIVRDDAGRFAAPQTQASPDPAAPPPTYTQEQVMAMLQQVMGQQQPQTLPPSVAQAPAAQVQVQPQVQPALSVAAPPATVQASPTIPSRMWGDYSEAQLEAMSLQDMIQLMGEGKLDKTIEALPAVY